MEKEKKLFTVLIDKKSYEVLNSEFTKAKCYVMYHGDNRNGNSMSKEAVEAALPSLYNIPVVGEFKVETEDFGTHGGKIEISDEGIKYIETTKPFGLVPESCNPRWELVKEEDGTEHEYLVADIILWSGRYSEIQTTIDSYSNQSMEILVLDGEVRKDNVYEIKQFSFSALCLLGKDKEPCFENSKVVAYAIDEFKKEMDELLKSYKSFACDENKEKMEEDGEKENPEEQKEEEFSNTPSPLFSATVNQKREALRNAIDSETIRDAEDNIISDTWYWIQDFDDEYVYVEKSVWTPNNYDCINGRFKYSFDETTITATVDKSSWEKMIMVWLTEEENQKIQDERNQYQAEIDSLKSQVAELQEYKKSNEFEQDKADITQTLESFEAELSESEEFKSLKENISKSFEKNEIFISNSDLEDELYSMIGRKKFTVQKSPRIVSRVAITEPKHEKKDKAEFGAAEKYFKNQED